MTYCCPPGFCPQSHYEKIDFRFPIFAFPAFVHKPITKNQIFVYVFLHSSAFVHNPITKNLIYDFLFLLSLSLCPVPLPKIRFQIIYFCTPSLCSQCHYEKLDFRFPLFALPVVVPSSITKNKILDYLFLPSRSLPTTPLHKI